MGRYRNQLAEANHAIANGNGNCGDADIRRAGRRFERGTGREIEDARQSRGRHIGQHLQSSHGRDGRDARERHSPDSRQWPQGGPANDRHQSHGRPLSSNDRNAQLEIVERGPSRQSHQPRGVDSLTRRRLSRASSATPGSLDGNWKALQTVWCALSFRRA
jgi:hypothetical protein